MTTPSAARSLTAGAGHLRPPPLPDPPRKTDMRQTDNFELRAVMNTVARFLDALRDDSSVLVSGNGYVCRTRSELPNAPYPDMLVAFDVARADLASNNGYEIDRVGKPPDFVLEVASEHTGRRDYTAKRDDYARLGILEYWRFDYTGGRFHDAPLAGDRLINGLYERIEVTREATGILRGYSQALGLYLCWDQSRLRLYDWRTGSFLQDPSELEEDRDQERSARLAAEAQRDEERAARLAAEARISQLEQMLKNPPQS